MCVFVCLVGTYNSWYEAAWLIQADWKMVRIITGFMEIYFAVICRDNIILWKDSLTVVHVRTDSGFFPAVCIVIAESMMFYYFNIHYLFLELERSKNQQRQNI